uniref:Uncharacterized protein n=1 Tax=Nelumbo nucifera TaxID=4432 RepID=A0A822XMY2_NELNU|nr:TPA_asm: hypothetical protein HUJ06_021882 [Nelumbo nucifera]
MSSSHHRYPILQHTAMSKMQPSGCAFQGLLLNHGIKALEIL